MAYRADIEIAVKGAQELKRLQNEIRVASDAVNSLNSNLSGIANLVPRSFDNLNKTVAEAAKSFNAAALGTKEATDAAREYIQATDTLNVGLRERVALLAKVRAEQRRTVPGDAGTGQQTPALPPQLIRTYEIGKNWVKFFQDAAKVAVDLRARSLNTQKNWNDFFATAAQAAVNVKANSLNTQKNWNDFFATAAQAAVNVKANSLNTQKNWNDFFATAAQAAVNVKANSLNTQKNWNDFFATAAQAAVNVKANSLNTQKNWNDFFATAAQAAVNVKANSVNTKNSWNTFFTEAAQLANDLTDRTREIEGKNSAAARGRLAADAERRRTATKGAARKTFGIQGVDFESITGERAGGRPPAPGSPAALKARNAMMQNAMIGGAFPMLFGGGAGAVIGGAAGGFIEGNPMMSIVTSALGTVVDQFAAAATEMGASLRDPITNFEKLKEANLFASKTQEFYIQKLIEAGRTTEATAAIQARVTEIIGVKGSNDLIALGASSTKLGKGFAELNSQMQAFIAGPLGTLVEILARFVGAKADLNSASNAIKDVYFNLNEAQKQQFKQRVGELKRTGIGENQAFAKAGAEFAQFTSKGKATPVQLDPATQEQQIKAAEQVADTIKGAYRTGFQLQQQALDLQRQGTDLQRRVADDIFNKQQQIARLQIDNERQRQQIAIETVDLEYRRRISQEEGRVAEALSAEADLLKTRAQGESNIATAKRLLELDITKQRRDTENYVYQLGRDIESIRRATLNYEMQVADYRLDIERKVAAERRVENAGEASGTVPSTVFTDGLKGSTTGTTAGSFPAYIPKEKLRAYLESQGFGRTSGDFTNAGHKTPNHILNAMDMGILGGSDANALRRTSEMEKKLRATGAFGNQLFGPISDPYGHGAGKGGQNIHLHIPTPGGKVKMTAKLNDLMQGKGGFTSSTASQLTTAGSQVTDRPAVPLVDAAGTGAALANLDATDAAIRKEAVALQERLNKLQESAAVQRLEEIARGPIDLQQRRDAVQFAKEDLSVVQAGNSNLQERLAFEAQSLVKLRIRTDRDKEILENTQLQGEDRKQLVKSLEEGLNITQQQIVLDREALRLAQEKRFAVEEANIQSQLGVTGAGLQAGFVGPAAGAFESEMLKSGNTEQATRLAELTNQLTLAQVQAQGMESSVLAIGDAFGTAMTSGVASLVTGTATAKEVFAQFLNSISQALLDAAGKMIATYIAIGIARMFAGMGNSGNSATALGSNPNVAAYAPLPTGFAEGGFVTGPTNAIIGEGGESEYVIPSSKMNAAMSRYSRGARGEGVIPASGGSEGSDTPSATGGPMAIDVRYSVERINDVEYVTASQFQAGMLQAAQQGAAQGEQRTLRRLQQSPSTRKRVGV